jgi:putative hemolysin
MITRKSIFFILGLCVIAIIFITGCTQEATPVQMKATTLANEITTVPTSAGIANPASVNCGNLGGITEIKKNPDGSEYGMCTFANGTTCEEWALFRNEGCRSNVPAVLPT